MTDISKTIYSLLKVQYPFTKVLSAAMALYQINPESIPDTDSSSIDGAVTPPETIPLDLADNNDGLSRGAACLSSCAAPGA